MLLFSHLGQAKQAGVVVFQGVGLCLELVQFAVAWSQPDISNIGLNHRWEGEGALHFAVSHKHHCSSPVYVLD